jgi:hypothetical protein
MAGALKRIFRKKCALPCARFIGRSWHVMSFTDENFRIFWKENTLEGKYKIKLLADLQTGWW